MKRTSVLLDRRYRCWKRLSWGDPSLHAEALIWLAIARFALAVLPFRWVTRGLERLQPESPHNIPANAAERAMRVGSAVERMARHTPWDSKCLVCAIAARLMLCARGVPG